MADRRDRLERVGSLVAYLLNRAGPASRQEIEQAIREYEGESGRRRFEDDKATLRKAGVAIRTVEHYGDICYRLRPQDYELPELDLTDDEEAALALAVSSVDFTTVVWSRVAGLKLGVDRPSPLGVVAALPGIELLPELDQAVVKHRAIRFRYRGEDREVEPWGLVMKHGRWYVPGWDRVRRAQRVFTSGAATHRTPCSTICSC
jgi:proteasome accessory factor B